MTNFGFAVRLFFLMKRRSVAFGVAFKKRCAVSLVILSASEVSTNQSVDFLRSK